MTDNVPIFEPKLITVLKEGYGPTDLRKDAIAGATVAVVALPLSMAIAIACGLPPETGLVTAIIGGFIVSAAGGSRYQVGGPAGAFIVPVAATLAAHGLSGLILATFISGIILVLAGALRLGRFVRLIPTAVVLGFLGGIAVIIAISQVRDLMGLQLTGKEPSEFFPKVMALLSAGLTLNAPTIAISCLTIGTIVALRRIKAALPGMLIAVVGVTVITLVFQLQVETLGDRFGILSSQFPTATFPAISVSKVTSVLPAAFSFALLGAIESLLSATVADKMTTRQHRSEAELVAQGLANMGAALFGGFCVTGTIARTATNIRAGAHGPIAGILHAVILLIAFLIFMPMATLIPFAALAGVLIVVAYNMIERHEILQVAKSSWINALALLVTFGLVVTFDLSVGIAAGCAIIGGANIISWLVKR